MTRIIRYLNYRDILHKYSRENESDRIRIYTRLMRPTLSVPENSSLDETVDDTIREY